MIQSVGVPDRLLPKASCVSRRELLPIAGGYFEWHDIYATGKQPYAITI